MSEVALENNFNFQLLQWSPYGIWTFKVASEDANCRICTHKLTLKCAECLSSKDIEKKTCQISKGKCNHGFHFHCIKKWLSNGSQKCPICLIPWNYQNENIDENMSGLRRLVKKESPKATDPFPIPSKMHEVD